MPILVQATGTQAEERKRNWNRPNTSETENIPRDDSPGKHLAVSAQVQNMISEVTTKFQF